MKLYQFKAKFLKRLILYRPKNAKEQQVRELLIARLENLRSMTMPYFLSTCHAILRDSEISNELKKIVEEMVENIPEGEEE